MKTKYGNCVICNGYYLVTGGKYRGKLLHRLIWEDFYNKSVPKDYVIHHINHNKLDNRIQNLQCVKKSIHSKHHNNGEKHPLYGKHRSNEVKNKISENLKGNNCCFNPILKIRKQISKNYKQGFTWKATPTVNNKQKIISNVNLDKCIKKLEEFLNSDLNTKGYTNYIVVED